MRARVTGFVSFRRQKTRRSYFSTVSKDSFAASNLSRTVRSAGAAAEAAADRKRNKYSVLATDYEFVPMAFEMTSCWGSDALSFVTEIGRRLRERGLDARSGTYLTQRLSIAIQRGNAASITSTFAPYVPGGLI